MNARFLRPFARAAFRAPTAVRPAAMARPALVASQTKKTEVSPQQMVRTAPSCLRGECWETDHWIIDGPQVCHAPAHPLLLRQRDHRGLYPPAIAHLRLLQVHPAPARALVRCPPLHQQVVSEKCRIEAKDIYSEREKAKDVRVPVVGICS